MLSHICLFSLLKFLKMNLTLKNVTIGHFILLGTFSLRSTVKSEQDPSEEALFEEILCFYLNKKLRKIIQSLYELLDFLFLHHIPGKCCHVGGIRSPKLLFPVSVFGTCKYKLQMYFKLLLSEEFSLSTIWVGMVNLTNCCSSFPTQRVNF